MRCHYVHDKIAGRVLIPGCWGTTIHGIYACTCERGPATMLQRVTKLEREIRELKQKIAAHEKYQG